MQLMIQRKVPEKLEINLGGVSNMNRLPDAVFVADPKREAIATKEVNKLGLPLIGLVDTNCDPDEVDYLIPGNDDAIRSCSLIVKTLARAVEEGRQKIQVTEFLATDAARTEAERREGKIPVSAEETGRPAPGEAPPSRVSRASRPTASEGRQGAQGRPGGPGRAGGAGRGGSSGRPSGTGRQAAREGAPQQGTPARRPASTKAATAKPVKSSKEAAAKSSAGEPAAEETSPREQLVDQATPATETATAPDAAPVAEAAPATEAAPAPEPTAKSGKKAAPDEAAVAEADAETGAEPEA